MEKLRIKEGVKGPAYIMVPLSESEPDRWMFNDVAKILYPDGVQSEKELTTVYDTMCTMQNLVTPKDEVKFDRKSMRKFHQMLFKRYLERMGGTK